MDILKVLSRGIKQPAKGPKPSGSAPTNLPSAGTKTNPQLFHDGDGAARRGLKRRRTGDESESDDSSGLPEVDFFAPSAPEPTTHETRQIRDAAAGEATTTVIPKLLDDDECRRLLRSHRLKFTLLSDTRSRVKKSKKKSKTAVTAAKEKLQLFPQPLTSFAELRSVYRISSQLADNLARESYRIPTEVQLGSLPLLLQPEVALESAMDLDTRHGVDLMAVAPTGSGKTMSFLIPAVHAMLRRRSEGKLTDTHELEAVVIAPTRELANQIVNEGRKLVLGTGLRVVGMRKEMKLAAERLGHETQESDSDSEADMSDESDAEDEDAGDTKPAAKADVLVTTPTLLFNFLTKGPSHTQHVLPFVRTLILDEADVLLDPLFRDQTLAIWSACTHPSLRTTAWSATMSSSTETLITETLRARAEDLSLPPAPLVRLVVGLKDTAVPNVTHKLIYAGTEQGKLLALRQLLRPTSGSDSSGPPLRPPFLVFTQTIERAAALHQELKYDIPLAAGGAARIATLHGGLSDADRASVMRRFRAGEIWVLTTTDVLARGIDFAGVNGVVNYDVPGSTAVYVHRAGRTGRAGREGGVAVTFYTKEDVKFIRSVANVIAASEKQAGRGGAEDSRTVQKWLLDALPKVSKQDKKRLKERGVEERRSAKITSRSGWERRREHNRRGAVAGSRLRKKEGVRAGEDGEWAGFGD